ncbi:MAG: glycosyl hydrolase-related protein [Oscillospiraceae bacterium]|nr:glycosyl hydrolase-related protein [Oscillospiraceae bacterium]
MFELVAKTMENIFLNLTMLQNSWPPHRWIGRQRMQRKNYRLFLGCYEEICGLSCELWRTDEPVPFSERETGEHMTVRLGDLWTPLRFGCAWMHVTGQVPQGVDPADPALCLLVDVSGEGLIVNTKGEVVQGITSYASFSDVRQSIGGKMVVSLNGLTDGNGRIDFWIDAANNDLLGNYYVSGKVKAIIRRMCLARCDFEKRSLYYDCNVLMSVYDGAKRDQYMKGLYKTVKQALKTGDRGILIPYLEAKNDDPDTFEFTAQGHSHLDLAWLWPIRETKRKGARTFSSQIMNLDKYPGAMFGASQAQLFQWIKDGYPDVFENVKRLHSQGRWEIQGATWVEPDSNLIGGESMIRQFYYGKKFFREEFGSDPRILWLPDCFGYSACLPQVSALADSPYFLTPKMSWNSVNEFPYQTFNWKSLDGSGVLAHLPPEDNYVAAALPARITRAARKYKERGISRRSASLFGLGDGGGGPGFEHYERCARMADLKGMPKYTQASMHEFFGKLAAEDGGKYPTHQGELYLEKHQGCYTTQSRNKKYNRKCEFLLRNYEILAAMQASKADLPIPLEELEEIWKEVLLYQFHDILPGSSISRVYEECVPRYEILMGRLEEGISKLLKQTYGGGAAVNLNSFAYQGLIQYDGVWRDITVPAFGDTDIESGPPVTRFSAKAESNVIENDCAKVTFKDGVIVSYIYKKTGRELARGKLNVFSLYRDNGDCWEIRPRYYKRRKQAKCTAFSVGTDGAKAFARAEYRVGEDVVTQEISLIDGSPLLRFSTKIRHGGQKVMLRVRFELTTGGEASFNVPFGHIKRATTENNSVEKAQYEVSGQKFVDITDGDFGISLLNDCKYGFRCKNGMLDMNLVRSPRGGPGRNVDFGEHTLEYALHPHEGPLGADTYREAYFLSNPVQVVTDGQSAKPAEAFITSANENIIVETVKIPEDGNGLLLRVYNSSETVQSGEVSVLGLRAAESVNVMEETLAPASETLEMRGFELRIIRFVGK